MSRSWWDYPWLIAALAIMVGVSYCMGRLRARSEHSARLAIGHSTLSGVRTFTSSSSAILMSVGALWKELPGMRLRWRLTRRSWRYRSRML